ncbi:hypothetical protein BUALT_Bualt06G0000100 [Buddleja alternifolia]|uniref:Retrotransposon gag domain-containing protein n=1 Tax=Buddleja alternifolia TaxID=168488 RepID=A0AAV6XMB7_9LAMI|nr:hypothetical protein BUALT_Bualt06G0000100 [Buddleja alternifolia]
MVDTRSNSDLIKEVDMLVEQMRVNSEQMTSNQEKGMEDLRVLITTMARNQQGNRHIPGTLEEVMEGGAESQNRRGPPAWNPGYHMPTKCSTIEFPRFNGEDLRDWIFRCEQFFEVDDTPSDSKVRLAAIHLEGKALQWHQVFMKARLTRDLSSWETYVRALNDRFGTQLYEDPMSELMNLRQIGSVKEYLDHFDELLNHVDLSESYAISCFLAGFRHDIAIQVRMFKPKTLQNAISLAKLQEQALYLTNKRGNPPILPKPQPIPYKPPLLPTPKPYTLPNLSGPPSYSNPQTNSKPNFTNPNNSKLPPRPGRRLTPQEMDEKRAKGLCFLCDEKYTFGHQCSKRRQLFIMEAGDDEEAIEEEQEDSSTKTPKEEGMEELLTDSHVSMHALSGIHDYRTMRVTGNVEGKPIHILIDTGSTHNVNDIEAAKRLKCTIMETTPFPVSVVDGNKIYSSTM